MENKNKESNNFLSINSYDKSNRFIDYSDSTKNNNDILLKAKESIFNFHNKMEQKIENKNKIYNYTDLNYNNNIYSKEKFYKDIKNEEPETNYYSNNRNNSSKNIFQDNNNRNYYKNNANKSTNINKNNNNSSPISYFTYNKNNNNLQLNEENNDLGEQNRFSIIEEEDENYSLHRISQKEDNDKDNEKLKDKEDFQSIINKTFISNKNYFINNNNTNNENNNIESNITDRRDPLNNENIYDEKYESLKKEYEKIIEKKKINTEKKEKIFNGIIEENEILKSEINKLIDENRYLNTELKKSKSDKKDLLHTPLRKRNNTTKTIKKFISHNVQSPEINEDNINTLKNENIEISKKNDELSKQIKDLKNRNKIQKKRIDNIEQMLKGKNDYIAQMEAKNKEIHSNIDKNNLFKTKYNELLVRFDIVNKELNQLKKSKNKYNELITEHDKLKISFNNLLKSQDKINDNKNKNEDNNEYKKRIKQLIEDNKSLNERIEQLKKEKILLRSSNIKNRNNNKNNENSNDNLEEIQNENENLKKINSEINMNINELKFENNSLKDICSEVQNKNKELKNRISELQNSCESNKNQYIQDINKLQKDITDFKEKELQEKNDLENDVKKLLFENNDLKDSNIKLFNENQSLLKIKNDLELSQNSLINNINSSNISNNNDINNEKIKELQKQNQELLQYKNKCNFLDKNTLQLKSELRKIRQERDMLIISMNNMKNKNDINNNLDKNKEVKFKNIQISNKQYIFFESINKPNEIYNKNNNERESNINNNNIEEFEKEKNILNSKIIELEKNMNTSQKKYEDLLKEKNKLEEKKNELIEQVNNLNDLIDLGNQDLVSKILDLKKVIEVLHKQIESEINKKNILENKLLKLQQKINKQIDEASEREENSINTLGKESNENIINNNMIYENENIPFSINKNENDNNDSYKTQILALKNENKSLIKTINNLKNEIKSYKVKFQRPSSKTLDEKLFKNIKDINDEDLIKDITDEMNKWKQEYYKISKVNDLLKENISNLEKKLGIEEQISYLKESLSKKDELLMNLTLQIKEYQSKSDDIILGRTNKSKDKQIEILLNEVKGIRKRLLNMITLNERITDFEEFMNNIKIIQEMESKTKDKNIKKAFEQLNELIEIYKLNNEMAYNDFMVKLFMIEK